MSEMHMGRSWTGNRLEKECPCPLEPCGLVSAPLDDCPQHGPMAFRSMRQIHRLDQCPGYVPC